MPSFEVLVNPTSLSGERGREQAIVVTANSSLQNPVTGRASVRSQPPTAAAWVTPPSNPLGRFPGPNSTCNFAFTLKIPADAAPGTYTLLFDVVDVEVPDDHFGTSAPLPVVVAAKPIVNGGGHPPRRWWILVAAAVLVLGVGFLLWKVFFGSKGMPDLRKKTYAEALALLDTSKFVISRRDTLSQDTTGFPRGVVVSQSIAPKTKLESDSNRLDVTIQQSFTVVPSVDGSPAIDAAKRLGEDSLLIFLNLRQSSSPAEDRVFGQRPSAGRLVPRGTRVTVNAIIRIPCMNITCTPTMIEAVLRRRQAAVERANQEVLQNWKPPKPS
jgi:PASTA domain-containing protein